MTYVALTRPLLKMVAKELHYADIHKLTVSWLPLRDVRGVSHVLAGQLKEIVLATTCTMLANEVACTSYST
jgi:hypothetical protein